MYQPIHPRSPLETMPTMYDLPSELVGESGLPDEFHLIQAALLTETCQPIAYAPEELLLASDLNLYYDPIHPNWYKRPDWYMVVDLPKVSPKPEMRLSYLLWQEGISPFLVVELLSPGTESEDLGRRLREINQPPTKWEVYERILRIPYYVVYDRYENNLRIFKISGGFYEAIALSDGRLWIENLGLGLGLWQGIYRNFSGLWLRWYDLTGWIPTLAEQSEAEKQRAEAEKQRAEAEKQRAETEKQRAETEKQRAEAEKQRAEAEKQRAEAEKQRADKLAAYLRSQGINPEDI